MIGRQREQRQIFDFLESDRTALHLVGIGGMGKSYLAREGRGDSPEGNQVYISFSAPMVQVNTVNNIVDGYATPNASALLTLKRGGSTLATATTSTKMDGWFSAFFTDANGRLVDIKAGDTVEVTSSPTMSVPAVNLSATLDINTDAVSGRGPANALLLVRCHW